MISDKLNAWFEYYLTHQDELVAEFDGKYIVIAEGGVIGSFDDDRIAVLETQKVHPLGSFLVQKVSAGDSAVTVRPRVVTQ